MINPQEILALYGVLIEGTSTQTIRQAEKHLRELYALPAFFEINKLILLEEQLPISVRKMSAVHIAHFSRKNNKTAVLSAQAVAKGLIEVLCNDRLEHSLKPLLMYPLEQLLSEEGSGHLRAALISNLVHNLNQNHMDFKEAVFVGQALVGKRSNSGDIKGLVFSTFPFYCGMASQLHEQVEKVTDSNTLIQLLRLIGDYSKLMRSLVARIGLLDAETANLTFLPQFQQAVRTSFELSLPGNAFNSHIYFDIPDQTNLSYLLNAIKRNYIIIFATFLRITVGSIKDHEKLSQNPLYAKSASIVEYCLQATFNLLESKPYYQLPQQSHIVSSLFEMLGLLITTMRIRYFDPIYASHRSEIIEKVFLPCLIFSPQDVDEFYENQSEFVGKILQINDSQSILKKRKEEDSDIEQFDTLKTYAGEGIRVLSKYQSQFLTEILEFTFNIIEGKMGCPLPKSVFILLASLLKMHISTRPEYSARLGNYLTSILKGTNPPMIDASQRKEEDIEYALVLLATSQYAQDFNDLHEEFLSTAFQRGVSILSSQNDNEVYKILVFQLFDEINSLENGEDFALDLLNLYNSLLAQGEPSLRLLDSYSQLLQYNLEYFKAHIQPLMAGIFLICRIVEKQLQKPQPVQLFLNKSFNIVREIGESSVYLPAVIPELQQALLPILPYIEGREGMDLEEDILLMLAAFLQHGKSVTLAQQKMFEIIPKIFYTQYHCTFGQAFTTIHSFIHYGANLLASAPQATQAIIEMSIASMSLKESGGRALSEVDNCEGVLVLQSLALACGSFFPKETWIIILNQLVSRLGQPIQENRLYANILGLISLILVHTQNLLSNQQNFALLAHILRGANRCLRVKWADKVLIVGLSQLMTNIDKQFIKSNFPSIFELILTLLDSNTIKTTVRDAIARARADEDFDYDNLITLVRNNIKDLDEFSFFKLQFKKIHGQKLDFITEMIEKIPGKLKDFLNRIMTIERVANEARTIFKIKKN